MREHRTENSTLVISADAFPERFAARHERNVENEVQGVYGRILRRLPQTRLLVCLANVVKSDSTDRTAFIHVSEGQLYAATVADFSGGEPLIHREKIRTERSDLNQLNGNGSHANCIGIFAR